MRDREAMTDAMFSIAEREGYDLEDSDDLMEVGRLMMHEYPEFGQIFSEDLVACRDTSK